MLHVNVDHHHTTNRTATTNGPISLAGAASLGKYGYGNGFTVMERISGTVLNFSLLNYRILRGLSEIYALANRIKFDRSVIIQITFVLSRI